MNQNKELKNSKAFRIVLSIVLSVVAFASLLIGIGICAYAGSKSQEVDVQRDQLNYEKEQADKVTKQVIEQITNQQ